MKSESLKAIPVPDLTEHRVDWTAIHQEEEEIAIRVLMAGICLERPDFRAAARVFEQLSVTEPRLFKTLQDDLTALLERLPPQTLRGDRKSLATVLLRSTKIVIEHHLPHEYMKALKEILADQQAYSNYTRNYIRTMMSAYEKPPRYEL